MMSTTGCELMSLFGLEPAPNAIFLPGFQSVTSAEEFDGAGGAEFLSRLDGFSADFRIWEIFREEHSWQPLAGYFPGFVDGEQEFAVWMSGVKHNVKSRR